VHTSTMAHTDNDNDVPSFNDLKGMDKDIIINMLYTVINDNKRKDEQISVYKLKLKKTMNMIDVAKKHIDIIYCGSIGKLLLMSLMSC
jgi:hypothetical protein